MESASQNTLSFECPACRASLTVPTYLAGIKGPCPSCQAEITAPNPTQSSAAEALAGGTGGTGETAQATAPEAPAPAADPSGFAPPAPPLPDPPETGAAVPPLLDLPWTPLDSPPAAPAPAAEASQEVLPPPTTTPPFPEPSEEEPVFAGPPLPAGPAPVELPEGKKKKRRGGVHPLVFIAIGLLAVGSAIAAAAMLWPRGDDPVEELPEPAPFVPTPRPTPSPEAPKPTPTPPAPDPVHTPAPEPPLPEPPVPPTPTPPQPEVTPAPERPDPPAPSPATGGADGARKTLDAFLEADDLESRIAEVQTPDKVRPAMEAYYKKQPVELEVTSVEFKLSSDVPGTSRQFHIFQVTTASQSDGFPVSVEETSEGFKVDWTAFVQFHDNALGKFVKIYQHEPATFHAIVERAHYFRTDVPDLGSKLCLRVKPPIPGYEGYAFVDLDSPLAKTATEKFEWDHMYFPVIELKWVRSPDGGQYIELSKIVQENWRAIP